jgi:RimJ/RimL family protein N-acetyltransferase
MDRINPSQANKAIVSLLKRDFPARICLVGVLQGRLPGIVLTDDARRPSWVVLQEKLYGTLFPSANMDPQILTKLIRDLMSEGEVLLGCLDGDPLLESIALKPDYEGRVFDFTDRDPNINLAQFEKSLPAGFRVVPLEKAVQERRPNSAASGDDEKELEEYLDGEYGYCLMREGQIISAATGGAAIDGVIELGVATIPKYRKQGYASMLAARLVAQCEAGGFQTYWNCNSKNTPSLRMAKKLGYRTEREYSILAWSQTTDHQQ